MTQKVLLVDKKDKVLGFETKKKTHKKGALHRAFSVYIFNNKGQLLIQRRSKLKPLWPLCWANSCCSHPQKNESYIKAGERRLKEELGFTVPLKQIVKFIYKAKYKDIGFEHELCAILTGKHNGEVKVNPKEVAEWKWVAVDKILKDFKKNPEKYTPWFKMGLKKLISLKKSRHLSFVFEQNNEKISKLNKILNKYSKLIQPRIENLLTSYVDKKHQKLVKYPAFTGGKRLRPALAIISCQLLGGKPKDILYPAAGLEILHNYTLIIDDIIDKSTLRRGRPTTWFKFGTSIAQCVGADYSAAIFQSANRSKYSVEISEIFVKTIKTIFDGEILDILFEQQGRKNEPYITKNRYSKIREQEYYQMAGKKTAFLFQSACEIGGICADGKPQKVKALRKYGFNLGLAFQIQDDILDIFGEEKKFGKKIGKDIKERKGGNIIVVLALRDLKGKNKKKLMRIIKGESNNKEKEVKEAISLISGTEALNNANRLAEGFIKKAQEGLKILPKNKWNTYLRYISEFTIQREK